MENPNEQIEELKYKIKVLEEQTVQINDTLLRDIKSIVPITAVYQLFKNEVSSRWGKWHRLETTDLLVKNWLTLLRTRIRKR